MSPSRIHWLALALCITPALASAQVASIGKPVALGTPPATFGRPIALPVVRGAMPATDLPTPFPPPAGFIQVVSQVVATDGMPAPRTPAAVDLSAPRGSRPADPVPPPTRSAFGPPEAVPPAGSEAPFTDVVPHADIGKPVGPSFWEKCGNLFNWGGGGGAGGKAWCSDACLPGLVSPVTMPFYALDPRALTEIRPILMYQTIPSSTPNLGGGNAWYFGVEASLAFTDRFSVVINELGFISLNPKDNPPGFDGGTGFAAVKVTPKYTFLKNPETGSIAAAGLMFDLPFGGSNVHQDNGTISLVPFVSYGQTFGRLPGGYGSLNFVGNLGYSLSLENSRTDFLYTTLHLDWNIANANKFFPLIELNWIHYTSTGNNGAFGFEGADLFNFGSSTREGSNYVTMALGTRYKFNENVIMGGAVEFPLSNEKSLNAFRFTFDVIFRY